MTEPGLAPIIAIVGSDGSGKSTVGAALLDWLRESRPAEMCHLGKQSGNLGRAIGRLPFVGRAADRKITGKAARAHDDTGPGALTAIVIYALSMRRVRRFRRMLAVRRRGITVISDRFPQTAVPGPMDGPGLFAPNPASAVARFLGRRELAHYRWMERHPPDLVIRLNVDLATAVARKPDHRYASLQAKVAAVPRLTFDGAPIVDIDATLPLDEVVARARTAIGAMLARTAPPMADR